MYQYSVIIFKMLINLFYRMSNVWSMHCTKWLCSALAYVYITVHKKCKNVQK